VSTKRDDLGRSVAKAASAPARTPGRALSLEAQELPRAGVVVGLDGSPSSWDAFWWACGEARRRGQKLLAVFVSHATGAGAGVAAVACAFAPLPSVVHEWQRAAEEMAARLQAEVERHATEQGVEVAFVHCWGEPAKELLRASEAAEADLIVVGKSTKSWHRLAGSISRQLVSWAGSPVVVVVP
jgi:nucleotide-binding universal stress UspA family protein